MQTHSGQTALESASPSPHFSLMTPATLEPPVPLPHLGTHVLPQTQGDQAALNTYQCGDILYALIELHQRVSLFFSVRKHL